MTTTIYDLLIAYARVRKRALATAARRAAEIKRLIDADHDVTIKNGKVTSHPTDKDHKW